MALLYSRRRLKLPKIVYNKFNLSNNKKNKKLSKFVIVVSVAILTFCIVIKSVSPIYEAICRDRAKSIATIICNEESTKIIDNYKYEDLVSIYKDNNGNITMIKSNITPINFIISDVGEKIQKRIDLVDKEEIGIRLGSFTGSKLLSGVGPFVPIRISVVGNVETDLRSEFKAQGINQTLHRIYLQVNCNINVLTPYNNMEQSISNQVLIAENVIVGKVPESYYNLEGIGENAVTDVMK